MVKHLEPDEQRKQGSFYTPPELVKLVYQLVKKHHLKYDFICDTSGGYGDFILEKDKKRFIYVDIDQTALKVCQKKYGPLYQYLCLNSLYDLTRKQLQISSQTKLLVVGNPPYNDTTSFYKKAQKGKMLIRDSIKSKDLGIAFLRSYAELQANYVCVLHPLSYLIKKTNFRALKQFRENYQLLDGIVVSSHHFPELADNIAFPILIALYQKVAPNQIDGGGGINYQYQKIASFPFPIYNTSYQLTINNFLYIEDFHTKYKDKRLLEKKFKHFYTLRDMNQLTINKTWLSQEENQSIRVTTKYQYLFQQLDQLKTWFNDYKKTYYFLGNLSPVIFPSLCKKIKKITSTLITFDEFEQAFNQTLLPECQHFLIDKENGEDLLWQITNIHPSGKYRFKQYQQTDQQGQVWANATKPLPANVFLEIQIAYDKPEEDFYLKPSLCKLTFCNNKNQQKYFFELSDILAWAVLQKWMSFSELTNLHNTLKAKKFTILEKTVTITRDAPKISTLFHKFNFHKVSIIKPSYISDAIDQDFLEIKIDYRQKASGIQAMLFYNINIVNLTKNSQSLLNQLVKKKDILILKINQTKFRKLFLPLVLLFAQLSDNHYQDMLSIVKRLLTLVQAKK